MEILAKKADCPTVPILSGQYRFEGLCPESRLYLSRDNECPAIGVLEYTCSTMAEIIELQWAWRCKLGAIINVTRTYIRIFIRCASATQRKAELFLLRSNRSKLLIVPPKLTREF